MRVKVFYNVLTLPVAVLILGCVPGLNVFLYSGHGGMFWFVLPLCFPYVLIRLSVVLWKSRLTGANGELRTAIGVVLTYVLIAYPLTRWTEYYVSSTIGLPMTPGTMFRLAIFPIGYLLSLIIRQLFSPSGEMGIYLGIEIVCEEMRRVGGTQ